MEDSQNGALKGQGGGMSVRGDKRPGTRWRRVRSRCMVDGTYPGKSCVDSVWRTSTKDEVVSNELKLSFKVMVVIPETAAQMEDLSMENLVWIEYLEEKLKYECESVCL